VFGWRDARVSIKIPLKGEDREKNVMIRKLAPLVFAIVCCTSTQAFAVDLLSGFLCCNMRTDGSWISDINYDENGKTIVPAGTPIRVTGYGHYRVKVDVNGKRQAIGNDYSRDLSLDAFAKRYVVSDDPGAKIAGFPKKIQQAIASARIITGMTREQVLMSVGYPVSSENHNLDDKIWRFWLSSWSEFRVKFDDGGRVTDVEGDGDAKSKVLMD
jgi:hypothetical protein